NLHRNGVVIYLQTSADVIFERTKNYDHRPLLNVENPKKQIEDILKTRAPFYSQAEYTIDTSKLTIDEVVNKILEILRK
ncbi:MAG: shikimate kinase, partial [Candidatus Omnitrophica bacterium]|nr:shikimate kinase [Candidatus Omnitrophota bacterium]